MARQVLVIDDDPGIRESLELVLQDDCGVLTASSAVEGLTILREHALDLVVLDYCLPDGPGSHVLQAIKRHWSSLPVIVITGYGSESLCVQLFRLGARDYFSKPYDVGALVATVRRLLSLPKGGSRENILFPRASAEERGISGHLHPGIERALVWLQTNYAEPVSLALGAKVAAMSPFHFCRAFKLAVGAGFHRYLTHLRVERAKELLRQSRARVADVAFEAGFSDLSSFYKAFHRATGRSPGAWRR